MVPQVQVAVVTMDGKPSEMIDFDRMCMPSNRVIDCMAGLPPAIQQQTGYIDWTM